MNIGENEGRIFLDDVVPDKSKRILTGDRPTGNMHMDIILGRYYQEWIFKINLIHIF